MSELSVIEKIEKIKEQNRNRAKRFYEKNKEKILIKRREDRKKLIDEYNLAKNESAIVNNNLEPILEQEPENEIQINIPVEKPSKKIKMVFNIDYIIIKLKELDINEDTRKKYINDSKTLLKITDCNDLKKCIEKPKKLIKQINNAEYERNGKVMKYSINSIKGYLQTILYLIDKINVPIKDENKEMYKLEFESLKLKSTENTKNKIDNVENKDNTVLDYNDYLNKIKIKFGVDSKEYLISKLYDEIGGRDNFGSLTLIAKEKDIEKDNNYVVFPRSDSGIYKIILQDYKTDKKYGIVKINISNNLKELIKNYIGTKNLAYGDFLFGNGKPLSDFISKMNKKIGIDGSINYLRHSKISTILEKEKNSLERIKLSKIFMHSPITQLTYVRKLKPWR
jgi:hypothetical protein